MLVSISLGESVSVQVEDDTCYAPDVMADLAARACEVFAKAVALSLAAEKPAE